MPASAECLSTESAAGEPYILRACFDHDTLSHVVQLVDERSATDVLTSLEIDAAWPPSPPWQELYVHEGADGNVLMLVGRAGTSHWSMSISIGGDGHALVFDVACRLREPPDFLGTTYQLGRTDFLVRPRSPIKTRTDLEIHATDPRRPSLLLKVDEFAGAASATIEVADDQVIIRAPQPTQLHATVRWKYRLMTRGGGF